MGNQTLRGAFKGHMKNEVAEDISFHMNAEFLFETKLVEHIYTKIKSCKVVGDYDILGTLKETNNQENQSGDEILVKKLIHEIQ